MYCCNGHNNHEQQPSPLANLPLLRCNHHYSPAGIDQLNDNGRRSGGVWIYFCFKCMMNSSSSARLNLHQQPYVSHEKKVPEKLCSHRTDDIPTVRVYCKAKTDYSLAAGDGKVILAPSNPLDPHQHWIKDETFGKDVKDEEGFSSFALVNKATGHAMRHSTGVKYLVQLKECNLKKLDKSLLWTMGKNLGDGYRPLRAVDNISLNLDLFGVKEGGRVKV
uniref:ricin B-like lectin R40G3 n=1 Tax=Erigeron canadensis TaxID=72917 RepID=UPI001CB8D8BF